MGKKQTDRLPPRAAGVTINGKRVTPRQWSGINTPLMHEPRFAESMRFLTNSGLELVGHLATRREPELRQALMAGMRWRNLEPDPVTLDLCVAEIVAVCQKLGLPGIEVTIDGWDKLVDEAA